MRELDAAGSAILLIESPPSVALRWTTSARADLVRFHEFLEPVNPRAAAQAVRQLVAGAKRIPARPRLGQRLREFAPREVRRILMGATKFATN